MVIKNKKGWTLIEVLICAALIGLIAMIAPTIITQTTKFFLLSKSKLELEQQARAAMTIITRELRQAQYTTIVIDRAAGQPYYSRLTFSKSGGKSITYYQSGSNLIMTVGTDTTVLTKNLAYLAFTLPHSDDMTILSVSMTLQEQIYNGLFKALHMASERVRIMN